MKRLLILVEGHTEKRVVSSILRDHLRARGVDTIPTILDTSPPDVGPRFKGGVSTPNENIAIRACRCCTAIDVNRLIPIVALLRIT
jgi:hypothetical protein